MPLHPLALVVLALAAYRITRLIVLDTIWAPSRTRLLAWLEKPRRGSRREWIGAKAAELLGCPFCAGVWVTAAVIVAWVHAGPAARWFLVGAAICGAQALLSAADDALGDR